MVAALAAIAAGPAFGQAVDTRPELQQRLITDAAGHGYGTQGAQLGLDTGVPEGKSVRYAFMLTEGETYYVNGGCDANCTSMALLMTDANSAGVPYTEDGNVIAHTPFDGTAHPSFTVTARKTTTYSIVINVAECHGPQRTCVAGAAVFHGAGPLTGAFTDELHCAQDGLGDDGDIALGMAGAMGQHYADANRAVEHARDACAKKYNWTAKETAFGVRIAADVHRDTHVREWVS